MMNKALMKPTLHESNEIKFELRNTKRNSDSHSSNKTI